MVFFYELSCAWLQAPRAELHEVTANSAPIILIQRGNFIITLKVIFVHAICNLSLMKRKNKLSKNTANQRHAKTCTQTDRKAQKDGNEHGP